MQKLIFEKRGTYLAKCRIVLDVGLIVVFDLVIMQDVTWDACNNAIWDSRKNDSDSCKNAILRFKKCEAICPTLKCQALF